MSTLRATNLKGGSAGSAPNLPDGAVVTGVVTATSFSGSGANLTGIDATALKDGNGTVRVQANTTGAVVTGTATATTFSGNITGVAATFSGAVSVGGTLTYEDVTNVDSVGLITARNGIKVTGGDVQVGSAVTVDTSGINVTGVVTATSFIGSGANLTNLPPGGNTVSMVADGAIGAGKPCIITTAGKAKAVAAELAGVNQLPDDTSTGEYTFPAAVDQYDLSWNAQYDKVLFSYYSSTTVKVDVLGFDEAYGSDTTSNLKTKSIYGGANVNANTSMAWDPDTNQTIIGYRDSNRMRISYASLDSGSEVTLGTAHAVTDDTVYPETLRVVYDTLNNAVICIWHAGNGNGIHARAGTISGDTMTWGTIVQLSGVTTSQGTMDACWDSTNNKVLVAFRHGQSSNHLAGVALSCSGTTLTWGSVVVLAGYTSSFIRLCFDSTEGKAFLTAKNDSTQNGYAKTFYINSGTTVTSGTDVAFPGATSGGTTWAANSLKGHSTCYDSRAKRIIITGCWTNSGLDNPFGIMAVINTGADTISFKGTTVLYDNGFDCNDTWNRWASLSLGDASLNWGKTIAIGRRTSPSTRLWMFKTCTSTTNLTSSNQNFLGFAEDAISDGATGDIKLSGNVVGNQSGLTPATWYAVNDDGSLSSGGTVSSAGGMAVASDKLRIKEVPKS